MDNGSMLQLGMGMLTFALLFFTLSVVTYFLLSMSYNILRFEKKKRYQKRLKKALEGKYILKGVESFNKDGIPTIIKIGNEKETKIVEVF